DTRRQSDTGARGSGTRRRAGAAAPRGAARATEGHRPVSVGRRLPGDGLPPRRPLAAQPGGSAVPARPGLQRLRGVDHRRGARSAVVAPGVRRGRCRAGRGLHRTRRRAGASHGPPARRRPSGPRRPGAAVHVDLRPRRQGLPEAPVRQGHAAGPARRAAVRLQRDQPPVRRAHAFQQAVPRRLPRGARARPRPAAGGSRRRVLRLPAGALAVHGRPRARGVGDRDGQRPRPAVVPGRGQAVRRRCLRQPRSGGRLETLRAGAHQRRRRAHGGRRRPGRQLGGAHAPSARRHRQPGAVTAQAPGDRGLRGEAPDGHVRRHPQPGGRLPGGEAARGSALGDRPAGRHPDPAGPDGRRSAGTADQLGLRHLRHGPAVLRRPRSGARVAAVPGAPPDHGGV
ncbi:MAG: hypothetical protein AVDCRST_MAG66-348, partial [uncultured Pseudonocardia sp.]